MIAPLTRLDVLRADRDDAHATVARLREALATTERRRALEIRTRLDLADDIRRTVALLESTGYTTVERAAAEARRELAVVLGGGS